MINPIFVDTPYHSGVDVNLNELLSYKQQAKLKLQPISKADYRLRAGNYLAKIKGRGMEFAEVRHYQAGDDVRAIDWAVTARTGKAHTKLFQEEKERPVFILLDLSDSMIFGSIFAFKSVQACHLASLLSWQAKQRGDRLGGIIFNNQQAVELKPAGRSRGLMAFLHQSESLCNKQITKNHSQEQSLLVQLKRLSRLVQTGSQVHLISDFSQLDETCHKLLSQIAKHNQLNAWQISDPLEFSLPQETQKIKINSLYCSGFLRKKEQRLLYQQSASTHFQQIADTFLKQGIPLYSISASRPLMEQFHVPARKS